MTNGLIDPTVPSGTGALPPSFPGRSDHQPPFKLKRWLFRLTAAALGLGMLVAMAEVGLRIMIPPEARDLYTIRGDTKRYKVMQADYLGPYYGVPFETNGQGFRSRRPYSRTKVNDARRIVVLGDSFAESR